MLRKLFLGLLASAILLALIEGGLRLSGFRHGTTMAYLQFGYPKPRDFVELFDPDPELLWKLRPGVEGVSESGFKGAPFTSAKPLHRFRVVVMGDSCMFGVGTPNSLPLEIEALLKQRGLDVEVINAGVPGYTTYQGRRLIERVLGLAPNLVLVSYVWNDHWLSQGHRDSEQQPRTLASQQVLRALEKSRLFQLLEWLLQPRQRVAAQRDPRVTPTEYAQNLRAISERAHAARVPVVFLSAPANHKLGEVPDYLVRQGFVAQPDDAVLDHRRYHAIIAQVANDTGSPYIDLEQLLPAAGRDAWFWKDGIHFTETGHRALAQITVEQLKRAQLLPEASGK